MNHRSKVIISAAIFLSTLVGCDELDLNGRLGNGEFEYQCIGPGDASCYGTRTILGFDLDRDILPIAVGSNFGLTFDNDEEASLAATAPSLVSESGGVFSFEEAATVDFYALSKEGKMLDFAPLSSQTATRIAIFEDADEVQAFSARRNYEVEVAAAPMNGNTVLSGGRSYQWSLQGNGVVMTNDGDGDNVVTIRVTDMAAVATLTVTSEDFSAAVVITPSN